MELKKGIPVSPGIVIGQSFVLGTEEIRIPQRFIEKDEIPGELDRFDAALEDARKSLGREIERVGEKIAVGSQILEIHQAFLRDFVLLEEIRRGIRENQYTAEYAVSRVLNRYIKQLQGMESPIIAERIHDLYDVERLLLTTLLGSRVETLRNLETPVVLIARNLTPSQTASLDPRTVKGFATDVGGKTSHTAIMARALGIPAVVALENISTSVAGGDALIIDGFRGVVILNPDERTLEQYRAKVQDVQRVERRLRRQVVLPSETIDGYPIELQANIELPQEVHSAIDLGASGIGLFRSEFIQPDIAQIDEELHFNAYRTVLRELGDRPLTIRTLDIGGDKTVGEEPQEQNPFLGCRSIRYCFARPEVFRAQLRAIYRASALGHIRLMLPMVGSVSELDRAQLLIEEVCEELQREGIGYDRDLPIGMMVEVPSAAITADLFATRARFFSVGTNDLIQYSLAVDRTNEHVAELYDPVQPAVLRLLVQTLDAAQRSGIDVSLCGEMGGEPLYLPLLIGLGFRKLSVTPQRIPEVKQVVRSIQVNEVAKLARRCLAMSDGFAVERELRDWSRQNLPDIGYSF
ncbi:MAG: phosphoenolpyruvate--protein phosphotransferase [Planctomycetes bacterium]|nr:phosphoenolpyruvate--protein phosphotransferase [Planctomycetota bacterium]